MNTTEPLTIPKIDRRKSYQVLYVRRPGQKFAAYKVSVFDKGNGHVVAVDLDALRADREARGGAYGHESKYSTRFDSMDAFLTVTR